MTTNRIVAVSLLLALGALLLASPALADKQVASNLTLYFDANATVADPGPLGFWKGITTSDGRILQLANTPATPTWGLASGAAAFHISNSFSFDGTNDVMGGYFTSSVQNQWMQGITDNPSDADASFELWIKPTNLTSGKQVLFETGGSGDGSSLTLNNGELRFQAKDGGDGADTRIRNVKHTLTASDILQPVQVVGVYDRNTTGGANAVNDTLTLYVNGAAVGTATGAIDDWDGGDISALGNRNSSVGGTGSGGFAIDDHGAFNGEASIFRFYQRAMSATEVKQNFNDQAIGQATLLYDYTAVDPGSNSNQWQPVVTRSPAQNLALTGVDLVATGPNPHALAKAFRFSGGSDEAETTTFGNTAILYDDSDTNDAKSSASFEMWIKPDISAWDDMANNQILAETGGGNGFGLGLQKITGGAQLIFQLQNSSGSSNKGPFSITYDFFDTDLEQLALLDEFIQIIGVVDPLDPSGDTMRLYVNGLRVADGSDYTKWWDAAGDATGIGSIGGSNMGGFGSGAMGFNTFIGDISIVRIYDDALTDAAARDAFLMVTVPEPTTVVIWTLLAGLGFGLARRRRRQR